MTATARSKQAPADTRDKATTPADKRYARPRLEKGPRLSKVVAQTSPSTKLP